MEFFGEKLIIRLWETITEKGIGSLLYPWQKRREENANIDVRVREKLALAQAEKNVEEIRCGRMSFSEGQLISLPTPSNSQKQLPYNRNEPRLDFSSVAQAVNKNILADSIRREVNISKALLHAEATLEQDSQEPPEKKVDEDWLYRWRDCASDVSSEQLQSLWGRLLAGEVKFPGSFSLRTLDFIKNLSQSEAESVTKLLSFAVGNMIFLGNSEILSREGINVAFLLEMEQLGIVSGTEGLLWTPVSAFDDKYCRTFKSHGKVLIANHGDPKEKLTLNSMCKISIIGQELIRLGFFEPNEEYLRKFGEEIKSKGFDVELADYTQVNDTLIKCFNIEKL